MALARLAFKNLNLGRRALFERGVINSTAAQQQWLESSQLVAKNVFSTSTSGEIKEGGGGSDVAVTENDQGKKKGRRGSLWRNERGGDSLQDLFPSSTLGNALMQATNNINRLLNNFAPSRIIGRVKEKDNHYKVKFHLPGLKKEDLKITVADGMLRIVGEYKEEEGEETDREDDDIGAGGSFYGYYDSTLALPEDVKVDEIKAEMKHGVLTVIIPKSEDVKKNVKEIEVN